MNALPNPLVAAAACGALSHVICHQRPPNSLPAFALLLVLPPAALGYAYSTSIVVLAGLSAVYLLALVASVAAYRLSPFHPLAKYPGPVLARVSRLWATRVAASGRQHEFSHELFARYGDVVRTGPNHLIIRNVSAIPVVLGAKNPWPKHLRYNVSLPYHSSGSVLAQVDPVEHGKRRRVWDRAFTPGAIKSYEPMLRHRADLLLSQLAARAGAPLDLAEWLGFATLDFMGDFAYNGAFDTTAQGTDVLGFHALAMPALRVVEMVGTMPWLRPLVVRLPTKSNRFIEIAGEIVQRRKAEGGRFRDLFYYLLNEDGEGPLAEPDAGTLATEASLAIVAGSDTTGTGLANAMCYLLAHPACMDRLRAEVDAAAGEDADVPSDRLVELKYLQAVLNETLRLQPAVPNGVQRTPPPAGGPVIVAGHVVPVGTAVQIPTWSIHRDPRYFSPDPDAFWPERWLSGEGPKLAEARGTAFALNQGAYMPFNYGPGNCVGRSLALHEMRTILAALVRRFDVRFAPGFEPADWERQLKDAYILVRGELKVVLTKRA